MIATRTDLTSTHGSFDTGKLQSRFESHSSHKLSDPYVRAFRFASDRIRDTGGIVCLVTNGGYIYQKAFDGMRQHLLEDFSAVYVMDLGGDVRKNQRLSGTTHNVFGIQLGVAITLLVRHAKHKADASAKIYYFTTEEYAKKQEKLSLLDHFERGSSVPWIQKEVQGGEIWSNHDLEKDFDVLMPLGDSASRNTLDAQAIFRRYGPGVVTSRDAWAYSFDRHHLLKNMERHMMSYARELAHFAAAKVAIDKYVFVTGDQDLKWTDRLIGELAIQRPVVFKVDAVRQSLYRPYLKMVLYFDDLLNQRRYQQHRFIPQELCNNNQIAVTGHEQTEFSVQATNIIACSDVGGRPGKCFPFYTYDEDGTNRQENITDWALDQYRIHYTDPAITKWDIFHSTYALLHHPEYRTRYAANLKRELPRIPFPPELHAFAKAGKRLMELHIDYERQAEYPLEEIENPKTKWTLRVERMRLSRDRTELRYNEALTLRGIPPAAYDYRLGNRSALEWVIDQYRVTTDPRSGIVNDPNRADDERYILRLIGQVITVSLETQEIVGSLPSLGFSA